MGQRRAEVGCQSSEQCQGERISDWALSLCCGRMGLGCCSCGLAPLQVPLLAAASLTHQGMRQDAAGGTETAWKAGKATFLSRAFYSFLFFQISTHPDR